MNSSRPEDIQICTKAEVPFNEFFTLLNEIGKLPPVPLENRVNIEQYGHKIYNFADIYFVKLGGHFAGLAAIYMNDQVNFQAYLTLIGILTPFQGMGLGKCLLAHGIEEARKKGMKSIQLEVHPTNFRAIQLYESFGLSKNGSKGEFFLMGGTIQ